MFCVPGPLMERQGVVSIFRAKRVILMMSVYSLVLAWEGPVIGMPCPMIKITNNKTNLPGLLLVWWALKDAASHGLCFLVEGE